MPSAGRPQGGFSGRVALGSAGNGPGRSGLPVPEVQAALPPAQQGPAVEMLVLLSIAGRWFKPAGEPGAAPAVSDRVATGRPKAAARRPPALEAGGSRWRVGAGLAA